MIAALLALATLEVMIPGVGKAAACHTSHLRGAW